MTALAPSVPTTFEAAAAVLAAASRERRSVRLRGAGTKPWTAEADAETVSLSTAGLTRVLAHDPGDMTATLQAGIALVDAQAAFAAAGQRLALDPPTGVDGGPGAATIGGIVATADSGPLAHRYGGPRELVLGATVALADGTIARSGATVIKNVAGYDIAKLLCGSFGTLGLVLSVNVRLHPIRPTVTAHGATADLAVLAAAVAAVAHAPAELEALDVAWSGGRGRVLAQVAGSQASARAGRVAALLREHGLDDVAVEPDDGALWAAQRAGQRGGVGVRGGREAADRAVTTGGSGAGDAELAVLRIAHRPSALGGVLAATAELGATLVGRAALGESYVRLAPDAIGALRARLPAGAVSVLRDCPPAARGRVADPWGTVSPGVLALMRALKDRFDPLATCNPGVYVAGI